jgi:hypothetical protein
VHTLACLSSYHQAQGLVVQLVPACFAPFMTNILHEARQKYFPNDPAVLSMSNFMSSAYNDHVAKTPSPSRPKFDNERRPLWNSNQLVASSSTVAPVSQPGPHLHVTPTIQFTIPPNNNLTEAHLYGPTAPQLHEFAPSVHPNLPLSAPVGGQYLVPGQASSNPQSPLSVSAPPSPQAPPEPVPEVPLELVGGNYVKKSSIQYPLTTRTTCNVCTKTSSGLYLLLLSAGPVRMMLCEFRHVKDMFAQKTIVASLSQGFASLPQDSAESVCCAQCSSRASRFIVLTPNFSTLQPNNVHFYFCSIGCYENWVSGMNMHQWKLHCKQNSYSPKQPPKTKRKSKTQNMTQ